MSDEWSKLCEKFSVSSFAESEPVGWIQWKGTSVCMDVHCACGELTHIDGDFTYLIQCGKCKRVYWPNAYIKLVELKGDDLILANKCNDGDGHHFCITS